MFTVDVKQQHNNSSLYLLSMYKWAIIELLGNISGKPFFNHKQRCKSLSIILGFTSNFPSKDSSSHGDGNEAELLLNRN